MEKERIDYIDLMKGICIIFVVLNNGEVLADIFGGNLFGRNISIGRMPLYFALSGLFFKRYDNFRCFFGKRFRSLIIPILVFAPLGGLFMDVFPWTESSLDKILRPSRWVAYLTTFTNLPLWFLRSLFIAAIIMYGIQSLAEKSKYLRAACCVLMLVAFVAMFVMSPWIREQSLPMKKLLFRNGLLQALSLLPFMYLGNMAMRKGLLSIKRTRHNMLIPALLLPVTALVCWFYRSGTVSWCFIYFDIDIAVLFIQALSAIIMVWSFAFLVKWLPYVSYIGRYSIVVLCTHSPLLHSCHAFGLSPMRSVAVVLLLMPLIIYLCVRYMPWACAQPAVKKKVVAEGLGG